MDSQEKRVLNVDSLEVAELEDEDLENVAGGETNTCPITMNGTCPQTKDTKFGATGTTET